MPPEAQTCYKYLTKFEQFDILKNLQFDILTENKQSLKFPVKEGT